MSYPPPIAGSFPKRCACGAHYADLAAWRALPFHYHQTLPWGEVHEARDCARCPSTIIVLLAEGEPEAPL